MAYKLRTAMMSAAIALIAGAVGFTGIAPSYAGMMNTGPPLQNTAVHSSDLLDLAAWKKKHSKKCYDNRRWSYNCRHRKRFLDRQSGYSNYYRDDDYGDNYPRRRYWRQEPGFTIHLGN